MIQCRKRRERGEVDREWGEGGRERGEDAPVSHPGDGGGGLSRNSDKLVSLRRICA